MDNQGWISLQRKIFDSDIAPTGRFSRFEAWVYLLAKANYVDNKWQGIDIKRGSFVTSQKGLKKEWHCSMGFVTHFLNWLKKENRIEIKTTNKYTVISILNYDLYQRIEREMETKKEIKWKSNGNQMETTNNIDKDNKENKIVKVNLNPVIDLFKSINPTYERFFRNKTERASLERLIKKFGEEWVIKLIKRLPEINKMPYAPVITTPYELEVKLGKLKIFLQQEQAKNNRVGATKV